MTQALDIRLTNRLAPFTSYKIERLPQRLSKILGELPPLSGEHQALEHEYSALFGFVKRIESLSQHVSSSKAAEDAFVKTKRALLRVCGGAAGRLGCQAAMVKTDLGWEYETRAFMLKESKKRILQVMEDLEAAQPSSAAPPPDPRPTSPSEGSSRTSHPSEAVPISSGMPQSSPHQLPGVLGTRRQNTGGIIPIRQQSPSRVNGGPTSTPRVRDIVRLGSYQNASLFSGSPVAVAIRKRFKETPAGATSGLTPPPTQLGKDYFSITQPSNARP